jgi:hypothetical protein
MKKLIVSKAQREQTIIENFAKTFNRIKRLDENELYELEKPTNIYADDQMSNTDTIAVKQTLHNQSSKI